MRNSTGSSYGSLCLLSTSDHLLALDLWASGSTAVKLDSKVSTLNEI